MQDDYEVPGIFQLALQSTYYTQGNAAVSESVPRHFQH